MVKPREKKIKRGAVGGVRVGGREEANFKAQHTIIRSGPRRPRVSETCLENGTSLGVTLSGSTMEIFPFLQAI